jgi:glycosyltransferase involved in cell wall biosynthesis
MENSLLPEQPLVSIIITNHNYASFLPLAIESALGQTYPRTQVVVVDDGSTDASPEVIASYQGRIIPVLKGNGGQGSGFNAGYAASRGDLVAFLDADDVFRPEKLSKVVAAWRPHTDASVIYHQLQGIDAHGSDLWRGKPWPKVMLRGNIRSRVEQCGGWWPWPVTSALCFPRTFLEQVLPISETEFPSRADSYLAGLAPFLGTVVGITEPLAWYRIHGTSGSNRYGRTGSKQLGCKLKAEIFALESQIVRQTLLQRLGIMSSMSLSDHYLYQYYRRGSGDDVPLRQLLGPVLRCPFLSPRLKGRELVKMALRRVDWQ